MPFHLPFSFPYFYNYKRNYPRYINNKPTYNSKNHTMQNPSTEPINSQSYTDVQNPVFDELYHKNSSTEKNSRKKNTEDNSNELSSDYFFEIFGLHLYFDDVLILCILFFLYTEGVTDNELFLCLILLLLS